MCVCAVYVCYFVSLLVVHGIQIQMQIDCYCTFISWFPSIINVNGPKEKCVVCCTEWKSFLSFLFYYLYPIFLSVNLFFLSLSFPLNHHNCNRMSGEWVGFFRSYFVRVLFINQFVVVCIILLLFVVIFFFTFILSFEQLIWSPTAYIRSGMSLVLVPTGVPFVSVVIPASTHRHWKNW